MSRWWPFSKPNAAAVEATEVLTELDDYVRQQTVAEAGLLIRSALGAVLARVDAVGQAYTKLSRGSVTPTADVIDHLADIRNEVTQQLRIAEGMGERVNPNGR